MPVHFSGFDGYVRAGDTLVKCMRHWSVSITGETLEVSCFSPELEGGERRFRQRVPGPLEWSASFDGFIDPTSVGQQEIMDAVESGEIIEAYFHLDGSRYYVGKGILTSESAELDWDGVGTISFDLEGTAPIKKVGWE